MTFLSSNCLPQITLAACLVWLMACGKPEVGPGGATDEVDAPSEEQLAMENPPENAMPAVPEGQIFARCGQLHGSRVLDVPGRCAFRGTYPVQGLEHYVQPRYGHLLLRGVPSSREPIRCSPHAPPQPWNSNDDQRRVPRRLHLYVI